MCFIKDISITFQDFIIFYDFPRSKNSYIYYIIYK